jgi:hypothetical protein
MYCRCPQTAFPLGAELASPLLPQVSARGKEKDEDRC